MTRKRRDQTAPSTRADISPPTGITASADGPSEGGPATLASESGAAIGRTERTGAAAHIQAAERLAIQTAHLTEGLNQSELARRFERTREAIANCLQGDDFEALKAAAWDEARRVATSGLRGHVQSAVVAWGGAIDVAADKGDHRPAKDLLEAGRAKMNIKKIH